MATAQLECVAAERGWRPNLLFAAVAFGVFSGYAAGLVILLRQHSWILAPNGKPVACDFLAYWTSGLMALSGHAASAYDPNAQHAAQLLIAGPFPDYLYWNYPPAFFFVAVLLASAPYLVAFLGWVIPTGAAYAVTIGTIARRWEAILGACASPVILLTAFSGQNGFLSAALLGGSLLVLRERPIISGVFLGLMTYKPQFGILIPVALVCGGYWRTLLSAAVTASFTIGVSVLAFGIGAYVSFFHFLPVVSQVSLTLGGEGWNKMQSVYAIARVLGAGDGFAWSAQVLTMIACVGAMIWLWRGKEAFELKAAGLVLASMLSTPYLHVYDFSVVIVALALLYRHRSFDRVEWFVVAAVNVLLLEFVAQLAPIGPGILMLVAALVLRRMRWNPAGSRANALSETSCRDQRTLPSPAS